MDLYNILEISENASEYEIKKAYHRLILKYHPDKNKSENANEKFIQIKYAYDILSNNELRENYLKMNNKQKTNIIDLINKIINKNLNMNDLNIKDENIKNNFTNFKKIINIIDLFKIFINKKYDINIENLTETSETENEYLPKYFNNLPLSLTIKNKLDIYLQLKINLTDINNKRKIKISKSINGKLITSTFTFNLNNKYIVYFGSGDIENDEIGNLIIELILPENIYWDNDCILIEQSINLYELIYGVDINILIDKNKNILIKKWVPSRDGYLIDISNQNIINNKLFIKLLLNYEHSINKENILKKYFCN
jgi:curved DNA-binding protein CbpA